MAFNNVSKIKDNVLISNVLISVYDKTYLKELVMGILDAAPDVVFYSTGGSFDFISKLDGICSGKNLIQISTFTGQPEMQGGLVKTLDWRIYLGLLAEPFNKDHESDIKKNNAIYFDMIVNNLYPFQDVISDNSITPEKARQNIDIGGPCMLRASSKNWPRVASVCNPKRYAEIISVLKKNNGCLTAKVRLSLAQETFSMIAKYDESISNFFQDNGPSFFLDGYEKV